MKTLRRSQTKAPHCNGVLRLPVSRTTISAQIGNGLVVSPYFQLPQMAHRKVGTGRDIRFIPSSMITAFIGGFNDDGATFGANVLLLDSNNTHTGCIPLDLSLVSSDTYETAMANIQALVNAYCTTNGISLPSSFVNLSPIIKIKEYPVTIAGGAGAASLDLSAEGFSEIDGVIWTPDDGTSVYTVSSRSISGMTVSCVLNKLATTGVTVLGLTVVGSIALAAAPNGATIKALVFGKI